MKVDRRQFLQGFGTAGVISLGGAPPVFLSPAPAAANESRGNCDRERILVLIQLAGGNDGLNTVIPFKDAEYAKARPGIAIADGSVLRISDELGFHPAMSACRQLFGEGMMAVVQGVGYPNPNRSHFRATDIWHSAIADRDYTRDGWLGRAIEHFADRYEGQIPAFAVGADKLPLSLVNSRISVPTVRDLNEYQLQLGGGPKTSREMRRRLIFELAAREEAARTDLDFLRRTAQAAFHSAERMREIASSYHATVSYPATSLGKSLELTSQLIAAELGTQIFFTSLGGFDTHARQAGAHQALLSELSDAIGAFFEDLLGRDLDQRVVLATYSEFGRRVKENGSLGTDHGAASQMFVVGPAVAGGVYGEHPSLTDLAQGDLKFHTDFRSVYATLLEKWLQFPSEPALAERFPTLDLLA